MERARALFAAALEVEETPEGLEGLGAAAFFLDDAVASFDSRERAFRSYRERDDRRGAARAAISLAIEHYYHRGDRAVCNGWVQRARRLLDGLEVSREHGLLAWWEGHLALKADRDAETARRTSARAVEIARSFGHTDLEYLALSLEGLALVSLGDTLEGMRRLDEATAAAVAGEIHDVDTNVTACCYLIAACELVRDYERAARWCEYAREVAERYSYRFMFSYCRTQYAGVLMHWGEWAAAEQELLAAVAHLEATKPSTAGGGVCRLAELRRRQGRLVEAAELYDRAEQPPLRVEAGPDGLLGRATLALDEAEPERAADLAERYLRRISPSDRAERVAGLELLARGLAASGAVERARAVLDELDEALTVFGSSPLRAYARFAHAMVETAADDLGAARRCLEDAVDGFHQHRLPYELAGARLGLAEVLMRLGRHADARREARAATVIFRRLGATRDAGRAEALLAVFPGSVPGGPTAAAGLTAREVEVLRLVADGLGNEEIAQWMALSLRTVERHLSNIYLKIGASGRVARAAAVTYAHTHGLASLR